MGFFSNILEKLGLKKDEPAAPAATPAATPEAKPIMSTYATAAVAAAAKPVAPAAPVAKPAVAVTGSEKESLDSLKTVEPVAPAVKAVSEVDVVKHLEQLADGKELDWKVSIVDLLKLLDIDSSREARNELATELGCPEDLMHDSAKMNVWLHKEVLKQIAKNGGNIPAALLD